MTSTWRLPAGRPRRAAPSARSGPAAGHAAAPVPVGRHGEQAPLALLVHEPEAVVGRLRHERPVRHRPRAEDHARRRRDLPAHVDAVDAELVGHHLRLERAAEDAAAREQPLLAPVRVDQRLEVVPEVRLVLDPALHAAGVVGLGHDRRRRDREPTTKRGGRRDRAGARLRLPNQRSPSSSTPWSTRTAPMPPSTETAAVVTIR